MDDIVGRDHGQEESGDLPCCGDCAGVCHVAGEEESWGDMGVDGEGVGDGGVGAGVELFGGEFGVGGGVCWVWIGVGVYGVEDQVVMALETGSLIWHFCGSD